MARLLSSPPKLPTFATRRQFSACAAASDHRTDAVPPLLSLEIIGASKSLLTRFASLQQPYRPFPVLAWNCHVETIFAALFRSLPDVSLRRECLRTEDGGAVALDWVSGDVARLRPDSPTLILLPGLTGGSDDTYVRHMLVRASKKGWRVVVFNSRGCGHSPVTTPQFYSASFTKDLSQVVKYVKSCFPESNLYAIGWSLGANILIQYLAQESHNCVLSGAVSLCNPFNLVIADDDFRKGFNIIYDRALAGALRRIFKKHALLFEDIGGDYNIPLAANAKSVRDFDDGLTRVSFGFKSVDDYYTNSSSSNSIKEVQIPLLCIQDNPNVLLIVTPKGGHLGWIAGEEAPFGAPWTDPVVMDFLELLEKEKQDTFQKQLDCAQQSMDKLHELKV
ncbi:embryogenesis-associated protein EMB8-like isoform X2 [Aristolochia californica]|uniref:embryogenesis-associated protein EMB8-like isoform X2 n=1 Tax=Aristolochia californica TaxID=171875 RepID=UPI0035DE7F33